MNPNPEVIVIGGGLVGASLSLALQAAGLEVALVEPHPPHPAPAGADWDRRIYAISPGNAEFLQRLGVWQRLDMRRVQRVETMAIFGDDSTGRLGFSAYDAGLRELAFIVESGALAAALREVIAEVVHIRMWCPAQATALQVGQSSAQVTLADGTALQAQLVVGTDGGDSWVRRAAGITAQVSEYRQLGVVANFATEKAHHGTAFQWFRPDGVLALLPLPGDRVSMVWSAGEDHAQALLALDPEALADAVCAASQGVVGRLQVITPAAGFPLRYTRVPQMMAPRIVLAGDAAHNVHPLAGQGVNLGFRDARKLAEVLAQRAPHQDCGEWSLLRRYERGRREDVAITGAGMDALQKLFAAKPVWIAGMRNAGLGALNRWPALKNALIRHAAV